MQMSILLACVHNAEAQDSIIRYGCEPPHDCWKLNSGLLEKQTALLTAELSLQSSRSKHFKLNYV